MVKLAPGGGATGAKRGAGKVVTRGKDTGTQAPRWASSSGKRLVKVDPHRQTKSCACA
jgi:hypothetical protein